MAKLIGLVKGSGCTRLTPVVIRNDIVWRVSVRGPKKWRVMTSEPDADPYYRRWFGVSEDCSFLWSGYYVFPFVLRISKQLQSNKKRLVGYMPLHTVSDLEFVRKDDMDDFDDIVLRATLPEAFVREHELKNPFIYVSFYHTGGSQVEVYDEADESSFMHSIDPGVEEQVTDFAKQFL